jgi:hypothetical protein
MAASGINGVKSPSKQNQPSVKGEADLSPAGCDYTHFFIFANIFLRK